MKRVIIESPFAGDVSLNINYARLAVKHSLSMHEAPIASHLLYTQENILDDNIEQERTLGIKAGLMWKEVADKQVFYVDLGWSKGMLYARDRLVENNIEVEVRRLFDDKKHLMAFIKMYSEVKVNFLKE